MSRWGCIKDDMVIFFCFIAPFRGKLPDSVIQNMEEQLSGSCTVVVAFAMYVPLGQLSGLEERKGIYKQAVETLSDANATRLVLVSRPEIAPLKEAARSSHELQLLGINNQLLVINGLLQC